MLASSLYGAILRTPVEGAGPETIDDTKAKAIPGVVRISSFLSRSSPPPCDARAGLPEETRTRAPKRPGVVCRLRSVSLSRTDTAAGQMLDLVGMSSTSEMPSASAAYGPG